MSIITEHVDSRIRTQITNESGLLYHHYNGRSRSATPYDVRMYYDLSGVCSTKYGVSSLKIRSTRCGVREGTARVRLQLFS